MFYRLPMTHSREEQNRVNTKYMTDGTAVLTFAVHLASTAIGPDLRVKHAARTYPAVKKLELSRFSLCFSYRFPQPSVTCCWYMSCWGVISLVRGLRRLLFNV